MKILTFSPTLTKIEYTLQDTESEKPLLEGMVKDWRGSRHIQKILREVKEKIILSGYTEEAITTIDFAIAIRVPFGGNIFTRTKIADDAMTAELEKYIPYSPLHLPPVITLLAAASKIFPETVAVVAFETAFFAELPDREKYYAVSPDMSNIGLRRFGYHGIFHKYAYLEGKDSVNARKILSICLENRPEIAAIMDGRPLMVTSGATPLEGLPGLTTCGEIDPYLITAISKKMDLGPEEINNILTTKSGFTAICGKNVSFDHIFSKSARNISWRKILCSTASLKTAVLE
ncbi:MAG: hypothetical protein WCI51_22190 [Lentisphaerota bacterium]